MKTKREIISNSTNLVIGIDEAGRGALAGPVVAAAVCFYEDFDIIGLDDSKKLNEKERNELGIEIKGLCYSYGIGLASTDFIYKYNILQASLMAMLRAYIAMQKKRAFETITLYIDGNQTIPSIFFKKYHIEAPKQIAIVDGDANTPVISAASILAKTFRDELMQTYAKQFPKYNFAAHKGYGTKEHLEAIKTYGACRIHRKGFAHIKEKFVQTSLI